MYEKVGEHAAVAKYNVAPLDTKWIDTDKAIEGEPMQIRSRIVARGFKSGDRPDLYAGTPPLEALRTILSIAASHSPEFLLMHVDVSRAYFHAKAQRPVLVRVFFFLTVCRPPVVVLSLLRLERPETVAGCQMYRQTDYLGFRVSGLRVSCS